MQSGLFAGHSTERKCCWITFPGNKRYIPPAKPSLKFYCEGCTKLHKWWTEFETQRFRDLSLVCLQFLLEFGKLSQQRTPKTGKALRLRICVSQLYCIFRFLCGENNHWASQGIKPRGQIMLENLGPKIQLSAVKEDRQSVKVTLGSLHFSQNVNTQIKRGKVIKRGKLIDCKVKKQYSTSASTANEVKV